MFMDATEKKKVDQFQVDYMFYQVSIKKIFKYQVVRSMATVFNLDTSKSIRKAMGSQNKYDISYLSFMNIKK